MLLHLSALIALMRGLSMSSPRWPCPVFCMYLSVEACLSPSLPFAVFALRLVGCDNVCCSSLVLSITAGSGRFPAVHSQSIYVPFGLVNSKKKNLRTQPPGPSSAKAAPSAATWRLFREIRSLMQQDWLRVEGDVRQLGGVCPSWFRGRDPSLPLQRFQSWWCAEDVLASTQLVVGGQPRMVLKLSRFSVPGLPL